MRSQVASIPYSEFQRLVREDKVAQVMVSQDQVQGELKEPLLGGKRRFVTVRVDAEMSKELDAHRVQYAGSFQSDLLPMILSWVVPTLLFLGIWAFLGRRMAKQLGGGTGGGLLSIGKSKAKVYVEKDTKVTFADVAGVEEAKGELQEVVAFLKNPTDLRPAWRSHAQGRAAGRPARYRQDPARAGRRRRGRRAVLLHLRLGVRGDVRGRRRRPGARPVRAGAQEAPVPSSSSTSWTRSAGAARAGIAAATTRRSRRSTSFWPNWTASTRRRRRAAGRHQPARDPGPRAAARRPVRPAGTGGPAGPQRPRGDPRGARAQGDHGRGRRSWSRWRR